jgi:hypothetical protein
MTTCRECQGRTGLSATRSPVLKWLDKTIQAIDHATEDPRRRPRQRNGARLRYVATNWQRHLRGYIEAMGGNLEIVARFPNNAVRITQFRGTRS